MGGARVPRRRRAPAPSARPGLLAAAVALALTGLVLLPAPPAAGAPVPPTRPVGGAGTTLTFGVAASNPSISPAFWGANLRPYYALTGTQGQAYAAAHLSFVRWPGGAIADRFNVTANLIYADNGTAYAPPASASAFVAWCRSVGCQAIVGLPGEIDDASTAAYYVAYYQHALGFTPAYYEIGNEPAVWTHFGVPWSSWNESQATNATPTGYADLVHRYIAAIRSVDPTARFIGLPGLGTGAWGETTWIRATVHANAANLSAVALHVYPGGAATGTNASLAQFYATLGSNSAISVRVPQDRAAIAAACGGCSIAIFASELGSGTQGGPFDTWMNGFEVVPYLAQEFVQAITLNLSNVDLFAFQSSYGGSLLSPTGTSTFATTLYDEMLARLLPTLVPSGLSVPLSGLSAVVTRNAGATSFAVLLVNTNTTANATVVLNAANQTLVAGSSWSWNRSLGAPRLLAWTGATPPRVRLAPASVAIVLLNESLTTAHASVPGLAGGIAPGLAVPALSATSLLGMVAPTSLTLPCWAVAQRRREERLTAANAGR